MFLRKTLILICSTASATCLTLGYVATGQGIATALAILTLPVWLLAYKRPSICPPTAALIVSVSLAALGLLVRATSLQMLLGATLALASWDLVLLEHTLTGSSSSSPQALTRLINLHYSRLALILGLGLLITVAGRLIHLQLPLVGVVLLVILALFSLDRVWRMLRT